MLILRPQRTAENLGQSVPKNGPSIWIFSNARAFLEDPQRPGEAAETNRSFVEAIKGLDGWVDKWMGPDETVEGCGTVGL